ncbi:YhdP family protein [uncultured Xylophilus sp.]|uniref:YhdP family protein n=1 Tax=uncultured Xylophilus sp. TaxID=296832 RepID=UPI0025E03D51|nr:YhdP family protein [uncultured Xylophilus sp.]
MMEPTAIQEPSRALKSTAAVARWVFWSLCAAWLCFFAVWGVLHGWIVPNIADYRPRIEAAATRALGMPVRIGTITARSDGLVPSFSLGDVALQDAEGRDALRLPLVVAALSPRSLLRLGFEQLYLEGLEIEVRRIADGRLFVAGRPLDPDRPDDGRAADWLFSQAEVVVKNGTVRWTDEQRGAPAAALQDVDLVLRNRPWRHAMRLDATPPPEWGARFTAMGRFRQPLLTARNGRWQDWVGQAYLLAPDLDAAPLRRYLDLSPWGLEVASGRGALRLWADIDHARLRGGAADLAAADIDARFREATLPLQLDTLRLRLSGHRGDGGFDLATRGLQFQPREGAAWPGGNAELRIAHAAGRKPAQGELRADRLDLAALGRIAGALPIGEAGRAAVARAPEGLVERLHARWEGDPAAPVGYKAEGRISRLGVAAQPAPAALVAAAQAAEAALRRSQPNAHHHVHPPLGTPGVRNATVDFDLTQRGGSAQVAIDDGALEFPGVFEQSVVPFASLRAEARWQRDADGRLSVQVPRATFANADAAGELRAAWHPAEGARPHPGVLDLNGSLSRADGTRVHRYLPQAIAPEVRHYVRDAVSAGTATGVQFRVRGDLAHMPFHDPKQGEFRIAAKIRDADYAYVPASIQPAGQKPWPRLAGLAGELVFDGGGMEIRNAVGRLALPGAARPSEIRVLKAEARIPDLAHTVVQVRAEARGPLADMLAVVDVSPLSTLTAGALAQATATGTADLKLALELPVADIVHSKVQGSVVLAGNDLRIRPDIPLLARTRGTVAFTETGFTVAGAQARMLGGDVRLDGGLRSTAPPAVVLPGAAQAPAQGTVPPALPEHVLNFRAQGTVTAEGLRQAAEFGPVARMARRAEGAAAYTASLTVRDGHPEIAVQSTLQGLALDLPAPLGKPADAALPMRLATTVTRDGTGSAARDEIAFDLGTVAAVRYQRDLSGDTPRVVRGSVAVGLEADAQAPLPEQGVAANLRFGALDIDAWRAVFADATGRPMASASPSAGPASAPAASAGTLLQGYLPDSLAVRADAITAGGRTLHRLVAGGSRSGPVWRASVDAEELGGYLEYRQGSTGTPARVFARLARLKVPESAAGDFEDLLDDPRPPPLPLAAADGAGSLLPALDIVVEDFELKGRHLGRVEVDAVNRMAAQGRDREWHLNRLRLALPEATFAATGDWKRLAPGATARRTALDFRLEVRDSGALLARFGMPGILRRGAGVLQGQVDWRGSPFSPDYPSMDGRLQLDMAAGQFLKADPGLAKLLGVLSLQSLPRRLALDFRDVFSEGFAFDFVRGDVRIDDGIARTHNLQMKGVNAAVLMDGTADLKRETQDLRVVVVPQIDAGTASLVAAVINPAVGLGTFLAQLFLRGPLTAATTQEFHITGRWDDPQIVKLTGRDRLGAPTAAQNP